MGNKANEMKVGDTYEEVLVKDLTRTQLVMYAGASGDYNPLHTDDLYTREAAGYPAEMQDLIARTKAEFDAWLKAQAERGSNYILGDSVTAVDFYWAAFSNLVVRRRSRQRSAKSSMRSATNTCSGGRKSSARRCPASCARPV